MDIGGTARNEQYIPLMSNLLIFVIIFTKLAVLCSFSFYALHRCTSIITFCFKFFFQFETLKTNFQIIWHPEHSCLLCISNSLHMSSAIFFLHIYHSEIAQYWLFSMLLLCVQEFFTHIVTYYVKWVKTAWAYSRKNISVI